MISRTYIIIIGAKVMNCELPDVLKNYLHSIKKAAFIKKQLYGMYCI